MSRKVDVELKVLVRMTIDEGVEVGQAVQELDYNFVAPVSGPFTVTDTEITDYEVKDSR